jgi:hypothetical protein
MISNRLYERKWCVDYYITIASSNRSENDKCEHPQNVRISCQLYILTN